MTEPTITRPSCKTEIKLTESLAVSFIESIYLTYGKRLNKNNADIANFDTFGEQ